MKKSRIYTMILFTALITPLIFSTISVVHAVRVTDYFTCIFVDSNGRWEKKTEQFEPTDISVYVWSEITELEIGTTYDLIWYWRNPDKEIYDTSTYSFTASGNTNKAWAWMPIQGRAPEKQTGEWTCEMYYAWRGGNWMFGFTATFTIGKTVEPTETVVVIIDLNKKLPVTVDGVTIGEGELPKTFNWEKDSTHQIMVDETVSDEEGAQYIFESWSDGNTAPARSVIVIGPMTYTGKYITQYYLTIESDHGDVEGEDWYEEGDKAYATLDNAKVGAGPFEEYVFVEWAGDASGTGLKSKAINMDGPKEAVAVWEKHVSLIVYAIVVIVVVIIFLVVFIIFRRRRMVPAHSPPPPPPPPPAES